MKKRLPVYDPNLGKKFSSDSSGFVISRGKSLPQESKENPLEKFSDPQQDQDEEIARFLESSKRPKKPQ